MSEVETLGRALDAAVRDTEPNVASAVRGGVERGRRRRRNRRLVQVAGSTAGIVAVGAASILITEGAPEKHTSTPTPSTTATSGAPTKPAPQKTQPRFSENASTDKVLDVRMHLPALLQQMLPSGTTVTAAPKNWTAFGGAAFSVADASGASQVHVTAGPLSDSDDPARYPDQFCGMTNQGTTNHCDQRKVPGGTVYIANEDKTAADDSGGQVPAGILQPGHEKDVVWKGLRMTFVPDDRASAPFFQITETTQVEAMPYANTPPKGSKFYQWPPTNNDVKGAVGTRLTISPDDFTALVGKPQLGQIETLLDPDTPPSQSAITERDAINAHLAKLAGPVLPPGVKLTVDYSQNGGGILVLTGPTGVNGLQWYTDKHSHGLLATNNLKCQPNDGHCELKKVPKATVQWADGLEDSQQRFATFEYVPDDPNGKEVALILSPPQPTGPDYVAKKTTAQLTYDQMLTIVTSPNIADIMNETTLLGK